MHRTVPAEVCCIGGVSRVQVYEYVDVVSKCRRVVVAVLLKIKRKIKLSSSFYFEITAGGFFR